MLAFGLPILAWFLVSRSMYISTGGSLQTIARTEISKGIHMASSFKTILFRSRYLRRGPGEAQREGSMDNISGMSASTKSIR